MPKIVKEAKVPLRRKEFYFTDHELLTLERQAHKCGFSTSKAYGEAIIRESLRNFKNPS